MSAETDRISRELADKYSRLIDLLRKDFFKKEKVAKRRQVLISIYAVILTVLLACRSGPHMEVLTDIAIQIWNGIMSCHNAISVMFS